MSASQRFSLLDDVQSLDGKKSGEKFHIVNKISQKTLNNEYDTTEIKSFFTNHLQTEDYFIKLVIANLAINTKDSDGVIALLKSEDDLFILKVIRNCDFFWSNEKFDVNFYINSIFPFLSYSNRVRVIETIARNVKNEKKSEEYYEEFKNNFSLNSARPFLKNCSSDMIIQQLKCGRPLTQQQILQILPQRTDFVLEYLRNVYQTKRKCKKFRKIETDNYKTIFKKLLNTHTGETMKIIDENRTFIQFPKLGEKITRNVLKSSKDIILKNSAFYFGKLKFNVIKKYLSEDDYKIFYKGLFPEKKEDFSFNIVGMVYEGLDYYQSKEKKLELLLDTYENLYGADLLSPITNLTPQIMNLLGTKQRIEFAQQMINAYKENNVRNKNFNMDELISYLGCDVSIPEFKEKIHCCSDVTQRSEYLILMIKSCKINDDMNGFLDVLKYFIQRHRNEAGGVGSHFLRGIIDNIQFKKLNEEHWKEIRELMNLLWTYHELHHARNSQKLFENYLEYQYKNNLPTDETRKTYLKWYEKDCLRNFYLFKKRPEIEKEFLIAVGKQVPEVFNNEELKFYWFPFSSAFYNWNKYHSSDIISIVDFKWICDEIDKLLISKEENCNWIKLHQQLKYDKKGAEIYLDRIEALIEPDIPHIRYFLKKKPDLILRNSDDICKESLKWYNY